MGVAIHDRVIRNEEELNGIREYMRNNPLQWKDNDYYMIPERSGHVLA